MMDQPRIPGFRVLGPLGPQVSSSWLGVPLGARRAARWVLKEAPAGPGTLRSRLREDFGDLASLSHPTLALPAALASDTSSGQAYLLRPYVAGVDIAAAARGRAAGTILSLLAAAAEALALLHRLGFPHGNLKPSNLLVPRRALFGRASRSTAVVLCDPDCSRGEREAALARDLLSLGRIFHLLLTGREPEAVGAAPLLPASRDPRLARDLARVLQKLLQPPGGGRYRSAVEVAEDLAALAGSVRPPGSPAELFLGREEELRRAAEVLGARRPAVIAVSGEAGMGKSALVKRIILEAQMDGWRTVAVRLLSGEGRPLAPLRQLVETLAAGGSLSRSVRRRLGRILGAASLEDRKTGDESRRLFLRALLDMILEAASGAPTLLALDGVHLADALSLELLAALVRELARRRREVRASSLALLLSFRSESPFRAALGALAEALSAPGEEHLLLDLSPLSREVVARWIGLASRTTAVKGRPGGGLPLEGRPYLIQEALRLSTGGEAAPGPVVENSASLHRRYLASLPPEAHRMLEALAVLGRPAAPELLRQAAGASPEAFRGAAQLLTADGTLTLERSDVFFRHGSFQAWLLASLPESVARDLHGRIARILERQAGASEETARHWLASATPRRGREAALKAARSLARGPEARRAAELYLAARELFPPAAPARRQASEEAAAALARSGDHRRALAVLEPLLDGARGKEAGRLHARMGVSWHRAGEPARAGAHLEKALVFLGEDEGRRWLGERLRAESELAEVRANAGDAAGAEKICLRSLRAIDGAGGAGRTLAVRRARMVLLENLAHLHLRAFRYGEARRLYEESLRAGEGLGAVPEMSLLLNNLGILHIQENRFREAVGCYARARTLSRRLADDQALAAIESNLAVLHARLGEPEAADEALRRASEHEARCDSRRTRFLRLHSAGLVDLILGRLGASAEAFRRAIALGAELGDMHTRAFDLVYLGECHLLQGEAPAARGALEEALALGPSLPRPVRAMVEARRAALAALRTDPRGARAAILAHQEAAVPEVRFLHAGNLLFLGWARRLLGEGEGAREALEEARAFFAGAKVPGAELHAHLELAALDLDEGNTERARHRLEKLLRRFRPGEGALRSPLLSARVLLYRARCLLTEPGARLEEAAEALAEGESYLIGKRLEEPEALAADLRRRLRKAGGWQLVAGGTGWMSLPAGLRAPAGPGFQDGLEELESIGGAAADLVRRLEEELGEEKARALRRGLEHLEERLRGLRRRLEGRREAAPRASALVGSSPAMRRVVELCRLAARSHLPLLVRGETGTGKELVARVVHGESPRRHAPFVSLSCAALPPELFEAELFGHVRGAFSGAVEDRPGLLLTARGGTFLFDEIAELAPELQARILRVLETGRLRPVGGVEEVPLDARPVFTTQKDLRALVEEGRFRSDLYYRIRGLEIVLPPLRERVQDLPELVEHFRSLGDAQGGAVFDPAAVQALRSYPWPGNVRELENLVTRLALTSPGRVGAEEVRRFLGESASELTFPASLLRSRPLEGLLHLLEREHLLLLLRDHEGDLRAAASALGIRLRALYDRMRRLGVEPRRR